MAIFRHYISNGGSPQSVFQLLLAVVCSASSSRKSFHFLKKDPGATISVIQIPPKLGTSKDLVHSQSPHRKYCVFANMISFDRWHWCAWEVLRCRKAWHVVGSNG